MKRVSRVFVNAAAVLSLVLCVAAGAVWVRSYWRSYRVIRQPVGGNTVAYVVNGGRFHRLAFTYRMRAGGWAFSSGPATPSSGDDRWHFLGFRAGSYTMASLSMPRPLYRYVSVPCWAVVVLFAVPRVLVLRRRSREMGRRREGRCVACGYDLRGNVSGVCSECGTPTAVIA